MLEQNDISKTKLKSVLIKNDTKSNTIDIGKLIAYKITNVFLPEELSKEQKENTTY